MDPDRKRKVRLVAALSAAVLLAAALVYTSFSASSETKQPSDLLASASGGSYEVTGKVVPGSISHQGEQLRFRIGDRDDLSKNVRVHYSGTVPDPFRENREVIVTGRYEDGRLVAERDSLITKCPSKFTEEAARDPEHVAISEQ